MLKFYDIDHEPRSRFRLAHALFMLGTLAETKAVVDWIEYELTRLDKANRSEPDTDTFRIRQGACQALENLLQEIKGADKKANQIQEGMKGPYSL